MLANLSENAENNKDIINTNLLPPKKIDDAKDQFDQYKKSTASAEVTVIDQNDDKSKSSLLKHFNTIKTIEPSTTEYFFPMIINKKTFVVRCKYIEEKKRVEDISYEIKLFGITAAFFVPFKTVIQL